MATEWERGNNMHVNTFYQELTQNQLKWKGHYQKLCQRAQERAKTRKEANEILGYSEKHHIIPRSIGGSDDKENLVFLSAREHFVAHQLLVKIYFYNQKLIFALRRMKNGGTNRIYEWHRRLHAKAMSEFHGGKTKNNCEWRAEAGRKSGMSRKGRTKETHKYLANMGQKISAMTEENCEWVKEKWNRIRTEKRTKDTYPGVEQQAAKLRGRTKENDGGVRQRSDDFKAKGRNRENYDLYSKLSLSNKALISPIQH